MKAQKMIVFITTYRKWKGPLFGLVRILFRRKSRYFSLFL